MKLLSLRVIIVTILATLIFTSCKKDSTTQYPPIQNRPPVARAGADKLLCNGSNLLNSFELDGGNSYDFDGNISNYKWIAISGPQGYLIKSPNNKKTLIENASSGKYEFELTVTDAGGLSTKDSVIIIVKAEVAYDLNITLTTPYKFYNDVSDPWGYEISERNYDLTEILGKANIPPLGEFNIYIEEYADTATFSDKIYGNYIEMSIPGFDTPYISGTCSINFKKLIREGGGPFSGTFAVTYGSARKCNNDIFSTLPPLQLSGSLNVTTGIVSLTIKGKTYF
jgi:hypothetical protein